MMLRVVKYRKCLSMSDPESLASTSLALMASVIQK